MTTRPYRRIYTPTPEALRAHLRAVMEDYDSMDGYTVGRVRFPLKLTTPAPWVLPGRPEFDKRDTYRARRRQFKSGIWYRNRHSNDMRSMRVNDKRPPTSLISTQVMEKVIMLGHP